jgi:hypothetical protein
MIVLNHSRMFGFSHFGVVQAAAWGCAVVTAPEGFFKGYSAVFMAFEGEWVGVPKTKMKLIAKAFLHPSLSKRQAAEAHEALLRGLDKRLDELESIGQDAEAAVDDTNTEAKQEAPDGRWSRERWNLEVAIEGAIAEAKEEGLVADSVTEAGLTTMEAARSVFERASRPQGMEKKARMGAEVRTRLIFLVEKFEAENNRQALAFAEKEGVMLVDPKLIELIQSQTDADGVPGDVLEPGLYSAFPTADATRRVNEQWPSIVASYRDQPNTERLLREKAVVLTVFVINNLNIATTLYHKLREEKPETLPLMEEQETAARLEEAAVWIMVVMNWLGYLEEQDGRLFMDYFLDELAYVLALQGVPVNEMGRVLPERMKEYTKYKKLFPSEGESQKDTLLWEAEKRHLGEPIFGNNPFFIIWFEPVFVKLIVQAKIYELLTGREASPRNSAAADNADAGERK